MPYFRREQLAGMGIHYMYYSLDYFLQSQAELGFKTIEMWCGLPHFILDDYGYQETQEQKNFLLGCDCADVQGFLFYRPMPVEEFDRLLLAQEQGSHSAK